MKLIFMYWATFLIYYNLFNYRIINSLNYTCFKRDLTILAWLAWKLIFLSVINYLHTPFMLQLKINEYFAKQIGHIFILTFIFTHPSYKGKNRRGWYNKNRRGGDGTIGFMCTRNKGRRVK